MELGSDAWSFIAEEGSSSGDQYYGQAAVGPYQFQLWLFEMDDRNTTLAEKLEKLKLENARKS